MDLVKILMSNQTLPTYIRELESRHIDELGENYKSVEYINIEIKYVHLEHDFEQVKYCMIERDLKPDQCIQL